METEVSVILITHNKYAENLLVLDTLEKQTYDFTKMEVILVDDSSTDQTISLQKYTAPFLFKYCRSTTNLGRAGAKNFGIKRAEGKIVIFLDGEVMVAPDFVANHLRHYHNGQEIAVSGNSGHCGIFTFLYPGFSEKQLRLLHSCIQNEPLTMERLARHLGLPGTQLHYFHQFYHQAARNQKLLPLLTNEDIVARRYKQLSFPIWPFFPKILRNCGNVLTGFHLAWIFFVTRNVSLRKSLFDELGPFNEEFKGWGLEDWELGYRLYKNGVTFIEDGDIISYHQEHPFSSKNRRADKMRNYAKFAVMYPEIEVCALTLNFLRKKSTYLEINRIIKDYYLLKDKFPAQFIHTENTFIKLTQQIPLLLSEGKPVARLLQHAGLEKEADEKKKLLVELEALRKTGRYSYYLGALHLLLNF